MDRAPAPEASLKTSAAGINSLKRRESCRTKAYLDSRPKIPVWTIGWGHTGPEVVEGLIWTQAQCDAALVKDLARFEAAVGKLVKLQLSQAQFDALVSLVYNIGDGQEGFAGSSMLRMLNAGLYRGAALQFCRWCHTEGVYSEALNLRRADEALQFCGQ